MEIKTTKFVGAVGTAAMLAAMILGAPKARAQKNACGQTMTTAMIAQRALDIAEIRNVASAHEYYHSAFMHKAEYENIWSHRPDIAWKNNNDYYKGRKSFYTFYVTDLKYANPYGALWYHMMTTPVIQVAGDGKTAQGVFMSFGNVTGAGGPGNKAQAQWTEEKYGIDFIKENGQWKIWHLRTYVEFYAPFDGGWTKANMAAPKGASNAMQMGGAPPQAKSKKSGPSATVKEEPGAKFTMAKPSENGNYYVGYYPKRVHPVFNPKVPAPYCHWKDTTPLIDD